VIAETKASKNNWPAAVALLTGAFCFLAAVPAFAEETEREASPATSEVVAAIKRRAQQILEERRRAKRLRVYREASQAIGYESNPSNGPDHVGDTYLENTLYMAFSRKLDAKLTWQGTYYGSFTNYLEYGDGDYTYQALTPAKLVWEPGKMWRIDAALDFDLVYYPKSSPSNYKEFKPGIGVRQNLGELPRLGNVYHSVRYEWFIRDYISKKARDGAGAETLDDRVDTRHRLRYELGTTWKETLLRVGQEWYLHDSNDARHDFYDSQDYRVTASVHRQFTKKLSLNAGYSFERKNYTHRPVGGITSEARYDDTHTWTIAGTYDFNKTWSFSPSFSYKFLDSNEPTGEYFNTTISGRVSARF